MSAAPGPYTLHVYSQCIAIDDANEEQVAICPSVDPLYQDTYALLAASWDLREALTELLRVVHNARRVGDWEHAVASASAALARANRGRL